MKRYLILDIDCCAECPCFHNDGKAWCVAKPEAPMLIDWLIFESIPEEHCPLRKLPEPKDDYYGLHHYETGWNECLEAIDDER